MRAVVQRVTSARVRVDDQIVGEIERGLLVLVGVSREDGPADVAYIAEKVRGLRVFEDDHGKMNRSVSDIGGRMLVVPQFTLYGDCRRGRRPSFDAAADPVTAAAMYESLIRTLEDGGVRVERGAFRAHMAVELVNDGPVTVLLDSTKAF
jgi:D-tyrosyl-tRNA(Tyr) deacylase